MTGQEVLIKTVLKSVGIGPEVINDGIKHLETLKVELPKMIEHMEAFMRDTTARLNAIQFEQASMLEDIQRWMNQS